jgi:O-antigen/teichoic acid export membrane protein
MGYREGEGGMHRASFFKHAAVYGLANLLLQGGGFVLLPIYLRCLTQADYGVLEVVGRLAETVGACLLFGGFRQGLLTFHQQAEDEPRRRRLICSALSLFSLSAVIGGGLALLVLPGLGSRLAPYLSERPDSATGLGHGLFRLAILTILLEPFSLVPLTLIQARVESAVYVVIVVGQLLLRVTLSILLVRVVGWGVSGALIATACTGVVFGLALTVRELARGVALPSVTDISRLVRFALPLMPGGLCFFLLHHGDRFFLLRYVSPEEVGIYALGYKLAMTVSLFSLNPLYMVWSAHMYDVARSAEAPVVFGRMFTRILAAYGFIGLGMCLFGDVAIAVLGGAPYAGASAIITPVLLGCLCQGAVSLMDAGLYVQHRSGVKLGITLLATVVMLLFYAVLIPAWGIQGAALATLAGFAFLAVCTWIVTQRIFPVCYEWRRLILLLALAAALWLVGQTVSPLPWALALKAALWLLGPILVWFSGFVTAEEKEQVRDLVRGFLGRRGVRPVLDSSTTGGLDYPPQPPRPRFLSRRRERTGTSRPAPGR